MREFKFRAWDRRINQLYDCDDIYFCIKPLNEAFKLDVFVFMQYTGVKDKNGVDIYEGDIVKFEDMLFKVDYVDGYNSDDWEIRYDSFPKCAFFGLVPLNQNKDEPEIQIMDLQDLESMLHYGDDWYRYEVIGNIYQNLEELTKDLK